MPRFVIGLLVGTALVARIQAEQATKPVEVWLPDYRVKAAFLYNFLKLTEWPERAFSGRDDPLVIGILGPDRFGTVLTRTVAGRRIYGRRVEVRQLRAFTRETSCHLLFVSLSDPADWAAVLANAAGRPILTVGESLAFAQQGGMIGLVREKEMIRLAVNREAVRRAGLQLSSRMLQLATIVSTNSLPQAGPEGH